MKPKKCECHAYSANECACRVWERVHIEDIKQNGIDPKSKLFWALVPNEFSYICSDRDGRALGFHDKPTFNGIFVVYKGSFLNGINDFGIPIYIKVGFRGDWKDSLHYRGDYE